MALEKATLIDTASGERFVVMFNPEEYTLTESNLVAEIGIPGATRPPLQYVRGEGRSLSMDLFFDTLEESTRSRAEGGGDIDVRERMSQITNLSRERPTTGAPPILLFTWGGFTLRCLLVEATQRFSMFTQAGTPVRATASVVFKEFEEADFEVEYGLFVGPPTVRSALDGDALSFIVGEVTGDPGKWREVAEANGIDDPFDLEAGLELTIPSPGGTRPGGRR